MALQIADKNTLLDAAYSTGNNIDQTLWSSCLTFVNTSQILFMTLTNNPRPNIGRVKSAARRHVPTAAAWPSSYKATPNASHYYSDSPSSQ